MCYADYCQKELKSRSFSLLCQLQSKYYKEMEEANIKRAAELKNEGNDFFKDKKYAEAIEKYSDAINYNPKLSILYSNRSRCHKELSDPEKSYQDAEKAVQLDDKNIKAYFLMADTLVEIAVNSKDKSKIQMAIQKLKKSLRLCPSQGKSQFEQRFVEEIYLAKKKLWILTTQESAEKKRLLRKYLTNIIENDNISDEQKDSLTQNINSLLEKKFSNQEKVPRSIICPITKKIMKDPICNQYGNSYCKKAYLDFLNKTKKVDPITNKPLLTTIMYNNINLKKAIETFIDKNPWAYDQIVQ